jgi:hypothetical protein
MRLELSVKEKTLPAAAILKSARQEQGISLKLNKNEGELA